MPDTALSKEEKHAQNRAKLSAAAQTVLQRQGYAKASLRDIAAEAGVSLSKLHYYFNDKSHLMVSAFRDRQTRFVRDILDVSAASEDVALRCRRMAALWASRTVENGRALLIWYDLRNQSLFEPELRPVVVEMEGMLVAAILRLVSAEDASAPLIEEIRLRHIPMLGGLFHHSLQRISFGETLDPEMLEQSFSDVLQQIAQRIGAGSAL
ncbi:TetR/AcrR family transcriptional regulator [Paracoccus sp. (in: a-proteobacteria)]|uniref:TetR/AcrR family transcriptional regulator n=1 Tax=Paracoccus sp. TaxID=267 RepID=UPI002896E0A5|nr:TetR/AcrR family transcriptional regulator [Paracoccus sp. (in: a-proteobacteria)]